MPNLLKTAALLLLTSFCTEMNAQTISPADQKGIEACYNSFMAAFEKLDPAPLGSLLTETAEHIIPNGELIRGRDSVVASFTQYLGYLKTLPKPERQDVKILNWQSHYLAPDVILTTYVEETTTVAAGATRVEKQTVAVVMKKVKGQWLADLIAITPVVDMPKQ